LNSFICFNPVFSYAGTDNQKKELFVMVVRTPTGKTFPGNFTIIPSAKKWFFSCYLLLSFFVLV
jgi:hypothetical protein